MKQITTRELVHHAKSIREALERGETFEWTQHGRVVAVLQRPAQPFDECERMDWIGRARASGAVARSGETVAGLIDEARGA